MAKRFTATEKWQDEWFSALKPIEKLVFMFMTDNCDNAGFFEINARLNAFIVGITQEEYLASVSGLKKGYIWSRCGRKVFILKFLLHQKNLPLNPENNAHKQILTIIDMNRENFEYDFSNLGANKGLISPIGTGTGKGNNIQGEENFKNQVFEKMRMQLDRSKFSDEYLQNEVDIFHGKYGIQNINKISNLIGAWVSNMKPDIQKKKMVI